MPLLWLFLVVWATDIFAYFVGRGIGGAKLAPSISPGKTWAGLVGGMLGAAVVGGIVSTATGGPIWLAIVAAPVLAVVAQAGDLFESLLKRRAGVKDSGTLIPGHGGALDRLDGLLFATPVYALLVGFGARVVG
jgi:phosphatidate cytidylyltransferase